MKTTKRTVQVPVILHTIRDIPTEKLRYVADAVGARGTVAFSDGTTSADLFKALDEAARAAVPKAACTR